MAKISESYAADSNYLKAADLKGSTVVVKIETAELVEREFDGKADTKVELSFPNTPKMLRLNKTNAQTLAGMFGDDTDAWIGREFEMFSTAVQGPQGMTQGIRVKPVASGAKAEAPF